MNDTIGALGLALGSAFTAGINLYATVAALGLAAAAGAIQLPPDLQVLAHPAVITDRAACSTSSSSSPTRRLTSTAPGMPSTRSSACRRARSSRRVRSGR